MEVEIKEENDEEEMENYNEATYSICQKAKLPMVEANKNIKKPHQCETCLKTFKTMKELKIHIRVHTNERPFKCKECTKAFKQQSALMDHMNTHTGLNKHPCEVCKVDFTTKSSLKRHVKRIHGEGKSYPCSLCNEKFTSKSLYVKHRETHINTILNTSFDNTAMGQWQEKIFKCTLCDKVYHRKVKLFDHLHVHHSTKYPCQYCSASFTMKAMKTHVNEKHSMETCSICQKTFIGRKEYFLHQKGHFRVASDLCDYCEEAFSTSVELQIHMFSVHCSEGNTNNCLLCIKSFNNLDHLQKHMNFAHVKCILCKKYFQRYDDMETHFYNIHNAFKCLLCNVIFRSKPHLAFHLNTAHFIINKFSCNICGKEYQRYKHLSDHRETHTDDNETKMNQIDEQGKKEANEVLKRKKRIMNYKMISKMKSRGKPVNMFDKSKLLKVDSHKLNTIKLENTTNKYEPIRCGRSVKRRCAFCHSVFSGKARFHTHNLKQHGKYVCLICNNAFHSSHDVEQHKQVHKKPQKERSKRMIELSCPICNSREMGRLNMKAHIQTAHTILTEDGESMYKCQYCDVIVKLRQNLIWHMYKHHINLLSQEIRSKFLTKVLCCSICRKLFRGKWEFEKHMAKHEDEYSCICHHCDSSYPNKDSLINHLKDIKKIKEEPMSDEDEAHS